jgi:hypothetical protein
MCRKLLATEQGSHFPLENFLAAAFPNCLWQHEQ